MVDVGDPNVMGLTDLLSTGPAQLLIAGVWQGLLLTACLWAGLKLAAALGFSLPASTRFALWLIVFLSVALLPALALVRGLSAGHAIAVQLAPVAGFSLRLNPYWGFALEALWVASSLFSLTRLLLSGLQMRALYVHSRPLPLGELHASLQSLTARAGSRGVQIRLSDAIDTPSVIGFLRPAVVMPRSLWSELSAAELEQILLHELAHLHRGDDWTNLLQKLLRALCPLNPALLWAERHLCRERERACDDAVLEVAGNARAYASCLTRLAETRLVRRAASLAPGLWKRPSELAARVDNILHRRRMLSPLFSRGVLLASVLASLGGVFFLQRCPALIAFTSAPHLDARSTAPDLAAANVVLAKYKNSGSAGLPRAGFHDAVFHPNIDTTATPVVKRARVAARRLRKQQASFYPASLRFVEMGTTQGSRQRITLILFTVVVPQGVRAPFVLPLADEPDFSLSDHWIAFQI